MRSAGKRAANGTAMNRRNSTGLVGFPISSVAVLDRFLPISAFLRESGRESDSMILARHERAGIQHAIRHTEHEVSRQPFYISGPSVCASCSSLSSNRGRQNPAVKFCHQKQETLQWKSRLECQE
jgi:hypothetical protein